MPASEYPGEGIGYTLSVEENQAVSRAEENQAGSSAAILGRAAIFGRVVNSKKKGIKKEGYKFKFSGKPGRCSK